MKQQDSGGNGVGVTGLCSMKKSSGNFLKGELAVAEIKVVVMCNSGKKSQNGILPCLAGTLTVLVCKPATSIFPSIVYVSSIS